MLRHAEQLRKVSSGQWIFALVHAKREREIVKAQFYQALVDSVTARLLPESESELRNAVEVLDVNSWPQDMPVEFGEVEIRFLCEKFLVPMNAVKNEFRDYKDSRGRQRWVRSLDIL